MDDQDTEAVPADVVAGALTTFDELRCAEHPDRLAEAICHRCGDHVCAECRRADGTHIVCRACAARYVAVVPWEDLSRPLPLRILASLDGLVLRPSRVMARLPAGKRGPAHSLLFVVVFFPSVAMSLVGGEGGRSLGAGLAAALLITLAAWTGGLAAALVAWVSGSRLPAAQVGRATTYAWTAQFVASAFGVIPVVIAALLGNARGSVAIAVVVLATVALMVALVVRSMYTFARGPLQLGAPGAIAVAIASVSPPGLLLLVPFLVGFVGYFMRAQ